MTETAAPSRIPVCGIGASAGGVEALQQFFGTLAPDLGLAYVVIVHLSPDHKSELPAILGRWTAMPVLQVGDRENEPLRPDHVYVIAPDRTLEITESSVGASRFEQPRGHRTAIDLFFRSLAVTHGDGYAVLLSGSGSDGALGARAVKESGGLILVQDPGEAMHGSMPRAAIATGVADLVLPVRELAVRLGELARSRQRMPRIDGAVEDRADAPADEDKALKGVLDVLRKRTGHDFSKYKRSTVLRRLGRRMQLAQQHTIHEYLKYLRASVSEPQALLNDLLISVTMFFRDTEAWAALQAHVIGPLVEQSDPDTQLRVWVPACATGEEAYSVAILLCEEFERRQRPAPFIVFASDVDESALTVAREGVYPQAISADVSDSRLERYFRPEEDHYRVTPDVRDHLVFASHSLLRDPPFSRVHLLCCRNLLIYLDRELQDQVMGVFRYACREDGTLFLGQSESAADDLFHPVDKKHRIFGMRQREDGSRPALPDILNVPSARSRQFRDPRPAPRTGSEIHLAALELLAPPTVVVDDRWNVVHVSATAARFFQQSAGPLARRLTDLVRPEIRDEMHGLLQRAMDSTAPQMSPFFPVRFDGALHRMALLAQQRAHDEDSRRDVLVTFLDVGAVTPQASAAEQEPSGEIVRSLREKLRQTEQRVEGMRDEHHLTIEDLRAANEELQSLNEEYRSTTEELETSKEELQSINEELHTVNHELKVKLEEVSRAHNDLENLMAASQVATLFLTPELRIKRFTPLLGEIFKVKSRDLDRPISDLKHTLDYDLEEDARRVLATVTPLERTARSEAGRQYVVRLGPYRTAGGRDVDGVVVTFIDVTEITQLNEDLRRRTAELEASRDQLARQAAELTQQDRHREEFLAALGHELRNPLAAIQGSIALVTASDERSRKALAVLERQARHMTRLINDLLDVTRVRYGTIRLERTPVDLNQAVASAVESVRPRADGKGLSIVCDLARMPVVVNADGERLAQILDNLLRNAVNYTDGGTITLQVHADDAFARIAVRDTGMGIEAADVPHLFEAYQRGGNNRRSEGLGLGLTLVKSLVEAHGGTITAESDGPGSGSEFSFTMPVASAAMPAPPVETVSQPARRRVLVVDDQRDVADMLAALLESLGQDVTVAYNARSALALARQHRPQVAFIDVSMPGVTGAELTHALRREFAPAALTLVAVSGHDRNHESVRDGLFDQHLLKPVALDNIIEILSVAVGGRV